MKRHREHFSHEFFISLLFREVRKGREEEGVGKRESMGGSETHRSSDS